MIFFAMSIMMPVIWFLPWWCVGLVSLIIGYWRHGERKAARTFALGAACVWTALSFVKDGRHAGVISQKLTAMVGLLNSALLFAFVFVLAFLTTYLAFSAGSAVRYLTKVRDV